MVVKRNPQPAKSPLNSCSWPATRPRYSSKSLVLFYNKIVTIFNSKAAYFKTFFRPSVLCLKSGLLYLNKLSPHRHRFVLLCFRFCNGSVWCFVFKVVAHLSCVSEPRVSLCDVVTDDQLEQLLRMCAMPSGCLSAHWGGPWATHALTSLLQDLLQGVTCTGFNLYHCILVKRWKVCKVQLCTFASWQSVNVAYQRFYSNTLWYFRWHVLHVGNWRGHYGQVPCFS